MILSIHACMLLFDLVSYTHACCAGVHLGLLVREPGPPHMLACMPPTQAKIRDSTYQASVSATQEREKKVARGAESADAVAGTGAGDPGTVRRHLCPLCVGGRCLHEYEFCDMAYTVPVPSETSLPSVPCPP